MVFCMSCGTQIEDNVKFCSECGQKTIEVASIQIQPSVSGTGEVTFTKGGLISILAIVTILCNSFVLLILLTSATNLFGVTFYLLEGGEGLISLFSSLIAILLSIIIIYYAQSGTSQTVSPEKIGNDSLPVEPQLEKCPNCGYNILMVGNVQKCTLCGYSSRISSD